MEIFAFPVEGKYEKDKYLRDVRKFFLRSPFFVLIKPRRGCLYVCVCSRKLIFFKAPLTKQKHRVFSAGNLEGKPHLCKAKFYANLFE
jgi:hypothetical protein